MSKVSKLPKTLPSKNLPFTFKGVGSTTNHKYSGEFVVKVPSTRELSQIGIETAKLSGGVPADYLDTVTATLNKAIAFLSVCLVEAPNWFKNTPEDAHEEGMSFGLDTFDVNIPAEIFKQANDLVQQWHDTLKGATNGKKDK